MTAAVRRPALTLRDRVIALSKVLFPSSFRDWVVRRQKQFRLQRPRVGNVDFGNLRRTSPISPVFALDRGLPIDRYYIEAFLAGNRGDIAGRVLEMGDPAYTTKFGGARVARSEVLSVVEGPGVTICADLEHGDSIDSDSFDCIILTQTLQMLYDFRAALGNLYRILKPGGVLLVTTHGTSKIGRHEGRDPWGEYWHFTAQGTRRLFAEFFEADKIQVRGYGNVLSACASLHGLATEELSSEELDVYDADFDVIVGIRAVK